MGKNLKSFSQFAAYANRRKPEKEEEQIELPKKGKMTEPLSTDVQTLQDILDDDVNKLNSDWEIVNVIDVCTIMPEISNELSEAVIINADLGSKEVKRGDDLYITAMLKKKESNLIQPNVMGVIRVRIIDIYSGLSILNSLKK